MKLPALLGLSVLTLALVPTVTVFASSSPAPAPVVVQGGGSKLGTAMEEFGGAVKALSERIKKGEALEEGLPDVWKAQRAVIDAKSELPETITALTDEKAKKKAALAYREQMQELMRSLLDVEMGLASGDAKKADKSLRAADNLKSAGHSQFRKQGGGK